MGMKNILDKIKNFSKENRLISNKDHILIGFSGGPDSVFLLNVLMEIKNLGIMDLEFSMAYFNHMLRTDSIIEENFVKKTADKYGLKLYVGKRKKDLDKGISLEMAARKIRYEFFEKTLLESGANSLATAHNLNDQAETFLLNLFRGCGFNGLHAMLPKRGKYIKPILNISRKEIIEYLDQKQISYFTDYTNANSDFQRNMLRNEIIPLIEKINNKACKHIFKTAAISNSLMTIINKKIYELMDSYIRIMKHYIFINKDILKSCDDILLKELLRSLLGENRYKISWLNEYGIYFDSGRIERLTSLMKNSSSKRFKVTGLVEAEVRKTGLYIFNMINISNWKSFLINDLDEKENIFGFSFSKSYQNRGKSFELLVNKNDFPLRIRRFNQGDRIRDKNFSERKLKRVFQEANIPLVLRKHWPVVENSSKEIIWVTGLSGRKTCLEDIKEDIIIMNIEEVPFGFK